MPGIAQCNLNKTSFFFLILFYPYTTLGIMYITFKKTLLYKPSFFPEQSECMNIWCIGSNNTCHKNYTYKHTYVLYTGIKSIQNASTLFVFENRLRIFFEHCRYTDSFRTWNKRVTNQKTAIPKWEGKG